MTTVHDQACTCGCCAGVTEPTPAQIENRQGLPALAYRVGTHGTFRATMQAAIAGRHGLSGLTTREADDPTMSLIDAWAAVLDVLTFYQERIANEGYLRTAIEARSVRSLAAEIGYAPSPGRAAATYLVFALETAPGAPAEVPIPVGTQVKSVPGPGEQPQTFETTSPAIARPEWNAMTPQQSVAWRPRFGDGELWLAGTNSGLKTGDAILIVGDERVNDPTREEWDVRYLSAVEPSADGNRTRLAFRPLGTATPHRVNPATKNPRVFALRQRAALFGNNAPDWKAMLESVRAAYDQSLEATDWPDLAISRIADPRDPANTVYLDAAYPKILPGGWVVLESPVYPEAFRPGLREREREHGVAEPPVTYRELFRPDPQLGDRAVAESSRTNFTMSSKTTRLTFEAASENLELFDRHVRETVVLAQSEELTVATTPRVDPVHGSTIALDAPIEGLGKGMTVVVSGRRARVAIADGATAELAAEDGRTVVLQPREQLVVLGVRDDATRTHRTWTLRADDGTAGSVTLPTQGSPVVPIAALATDDSVAEAATLDDPGSPNPVRTTLALAQPLTHAYDRATCTISANVVLATGGETKREVLGSADASQAYQRFALKQSPLTFVPSADPSGASSTLRVTVNGVAWEEGACLYGLGPKDRVYVVHIADDGAATIEFGDGATGARPPTGRENVLATYRVGTGTPGNVDAGTLSMLVTRPLGVSRVSNPLAAAGGVDPEGRDEARENAPARVLAFDRVVSLTDYADFARAFAGIGKARAAWLWDGEARLVVLTVSGADGPVDQITLAGLEAALRAAGDPHRGFLVLPAEAPTFRTSAGLWLKDGYSWDSVKAAAEAAVRDAFSFRRRDFAQSVSGSEVVATIQGVDGVLAVDLDDLRTLGGSPPSTPLLPALPARQTDSGIAAAQVLAVDPAETSVDLKERA